MWSRQDSIETDAGADRIWKLFEDVNRWSRWNDGIEFIQLHGPFAAGTTFTMKPPGQDAMNHQPSDVRLRLADRSQMTMEMRCADDLIGPDHAARTIWRE